MTQPRIFYLDPPLSRRTTDIPIKIGAQLHLDEKASHHLVRVLRLKLGERIHVFNNSDGEFVAEISSINKSVVTVTILDFLPNQTESPLPIHLGQGIARGEKMDFIVQKAVELGVKSFTPLITEYCNVRLDEARLARRVQHWQAVAISASEQCGRSHIVSISTPVSLAAWVKSVQEKTRFVLTPDEVGGLPSQLRTADGIAVLVGPEGGLSAAEIKSALSQGFQPVRLGPRILRTETAGLAILSILQFAYGDMR